MALLRPSRPDAEASKALHRKIRKYGAALLARQYGLGGLAALGSAAACEVLRIPLANGLALGILAGAAGAILLALLAFETAIQTAIRIGADAEVEQMARARRGSVAGATALSAWVLAFGLLLVLGPYFISGGAVPDLFGVAVGVGLVSLVATVMSWLPMNENAQSSPVGSVSPSIREFVRRGVESTLPSIDLLAVAVACVASAMFMGYRDQFVLLLFPNSIVYPTVVAGIGIVALLAGGSVWAIGRSKGADLGVAYGGLIVATAVALVGQLIFVILAMNANLGIFLASALGTAGGAACLVPFLASRGAIPGPSPPSSVRSSRALAAPVIGVAALIAVVAIIAFWAAGQLVVGRGQNPIPDVGYYGLGLSGVGMVSILGPALLIASLPVLGGSAIVWPRLPGELELPLELTEQLQKGAARTRRGGRLFLLFASALGSLGLVAAGRIAIANVLGTPVVGVFATIHQAMGLGALGFALGILAALLLVWVLNRSREHFATEASPSAPRDPRRAVSVAFVAILIATVGSLVVSRVWGAYAAFGLALGLLIVALPLAVASDLWYDPLPPSPDPKSPAPSPSSPIDLDRVVLTWSAVIRTTSLLCAFAIVPFASAITSFYKG